MRILKETWLKSVNCVNCVMQIFANKPSNRQTVMTENKIHISTMTRQWLDNGSRMDRVLSRNFSLRYAACVVMMLMGSMSVWGEACTVFEDATGVSIKNTSPFYTSSTFTNDGGVDSIRFTYQTSDSNKAKNVELYYSKDGGSSYTLIDDYARDKGVGGRTLTITLAGDQKNANRFQFRVRGGATNHTYQVRDIKVYRSPKVAINTSSYEFDETAVGGSLYHDFTISAYSMPDGVVITSDSVVISGTDEDLFACTSISDPDGSCPTTRTLRITYSPTSVATSESKHTATVTVKAGGKTTSMTVYGTASELATPVYTSTLAATYYVGDEINLNSLWFSTSNATKNYSITTWTAETGIPTTGAATPTITAGVLSASQAGTIILGLSQDEIEEDGVGYKAGTATPQTITIARRSNVLKCAWDGGSAGDLWKDTIGFDTKYRVKFSSNNNEEGAPAISVTPSPASAVATYKAAGSSSNPDTLITNYRKGDVFWTVTQAENYKYVEATATCTLRVGTKASLGYDIYLYNSGAGTNNEGFETEKVFGKKGWTADGTPVRVDFEARTSDESGFLGSDHAWIQVKQHTKSSGWKNAGTSIKDSFKNSFDGTGGQSRNLDSDADSIAFEVGGAGSEKFVRNVKVVATTPYLNIDTIGGASFSTLNMPNNAKGGLVKRAKFLVDYGTCADNIKLVSSHERIKFAANNSTTYSYAVNADRHSRDTIELTYTSPVSEGEDVTATITVYTPYEHETLTVKAKTKATLDTRLVYVGEEEYNADLANKAATELFKVVDENNDTLVSPNITLSSSATSVINIVSSTTVDFVSGGGSARITATYTGDSNYEAASNIDTLITVNKVDDQITWSGLVNDTLHVWMDDTIPYTIASAKNSNAKPITFASSDALSFKVVEGTEIDTMTTLKHDTINLTATTTADGVYNSVTSTKVVVIDKCIHRIVWNQEFVNFTTDDSGNIKDSILLSAYAVDSVNKATGVTVNFEITSGSDVACIRNGYLVVTKEGDAVVTATTTSSTKYGTAIETKDVRANRPGVNNAYTKNNSSDISSNSIIIEAPHARFALGGETDITQYYGSNGYSLASDFGKGRMAYTLNWRTTNPNCSIQVTRISFWAKAYCANFFLSSDNAKVEFAGDAGKAVGTAALTSNSGDYAKFDKSATFTSGVNITCVSTGNNDYDFYIKNLTIEYTVYTTTAPTPTEGAAEVMVTVNEGNKHKLDLRDLFSVADAPDDFTYQGQLSAANAHAHIEDEATMFWADSVGDYTIQGRVKPTADHRESAWSVATKTIRVVKHSNKVKMGGSEDYNETMNLRSTLTSVALTSDNTDETEIVCTQIAGVDTISYNPSTQVVTSGSVLGVGKWRVYQAASDRFVEAVDTFTVTITNDTFEFTGATDSDWSTDANWASGKPTANDNVTVSHNMTISTEVEVYSLTIGEGDTVTIAPTGGLTVGAGGISGSTDSTLILKAGTADATKGQTGYLRISPNYTDTMPHAKVELFSKGYYNKAGSAAKNEAAWQYVGAPIDFDGAYAKTVFTRSWIYDYNEATDKWSNHRSTLVMEPFVGYATTQYDTENGKLLAYPGKLVPNRGLKTINLAYTDAAHGHNMVANSFAAPIDITQFRDTDFVNAEQTIYLFNTGSKNNEDLENAGDAAGQYRTIAIGTASEMASLFAGDASLPTTIAPMQGFWVNATGSGAKLKLDYNKLVWNADYTTHQPKPLRAPKKKAEEEAPITGAMKITLEADGWTDDVYLLESQRYGSEFEDGYDAHKMESGTLNIFAMADEEKLAIDATSSIAETKIGVRTGEESAYTMRFSYVQGETDWTLIDTEAKKEIDIEDGTEYPFYAATNDTITERFLIVERSKAPAITTGVDGVDAEVKAQKFIKDNQLYILKDGVLYDAFGRKVR